VAPQNEDAGLAVVCVVVTRVKISKFNVTAPASFFLLKVILNIVLLNVFQQLIRNNCSDREAD
jgi:hypothetical protein